MTKVLPDLNLATRKQVSVMHPAHSPQDSLRSALFWRPFTCEPLMRSFDDLRPLVWGRIPKLSSATGCKSQRLIRTVL
jgi:hypothetical protein